MSNTDTIRERCWASVCDEDGNRTLLFMLADPDDGSPTLLQVLINAENGVKDLGFRRLSRREADTLISNLDSRIEHGLALAEIEPDYGRWLVEQAREINRQRRHSTPPRAGGNESLPWAWNDMPADGNGAEPQSPGQAPPAGPGSVTNRFQAGVRTILIVILVAALLGGGIAIGIVGFFHSYDQYKANAVSQRVNTLSSQGAAAYNAHDYATAARLFEQARSANPSADERTKIDYNLTATYIQLAQQAQANRNFPEVQNFYRKALAITPDSQLAHAGLAAILESQGDANGAVKERSAAENGSDQALPPSLNGVSAFSGAGSDTSSGSGDASLDTVRAKSRDLINQGMQLYQQGQVEQAHEKWQEAIGIAPNTPERDQAKQLIDASPLSPNG